MSWCRLAETEDLALQAFALGERAGQPGSFANAGLLIFAVRREQGRLDESEPALIAAMANVPALPVPRCLLALCYTEPGRADEARSLFETLAANDFKDWWALHWRSSLVGCLADVCAELADQRRAAALYELARSFAGCHVALGPKVYFGPYDHHLGTLAAALERWDAAADHSEKSIALSRATGGIPWLARSQWGLARVLRARGAPGDEERAAEILREALTTSERTGMTRVAERIQAGKASSTIAPPRRDDGAKEAVRMGVHSHCTSPPRCRSNR